jgi:hypothetical protein
LYQTVPVYSSPPDIAGAASTPSEEGDLDNWEDYISFSPGPVMEEKLAESAMEEKPAESAMEEKPAESAKVDVEMGMRPVTKEDVTQLPSWPAHFWNNLKLVMAYLAPFPNLLLTFSRPEYNYRSFVWDQCPEVIRVDTVDFRVKRRKSWSG